MSEPEFTEATILDPLIGHNLNDCYVIDRFGKSGGMGEVYFGRNLQTNKPVAIKLVLERHASNTKLIAMFQQEAELLESITHDALVKYQLFGFDRSINRQFLVTEFVPGPSISAVLKGYPREPETVRAVLKRLASGMAAAHAVNVCHRDLSPDNVLLPQARVEAAKIIDFGIGGDMRPGRDLLAEHDVAGKYGYAAPEALGNFGSQTDARSDVYSLALTVLALAQGKPIDMGHDLLQAQERRKTIPDLDWLEGNLKGIFRPMLIPDPKDRLQSMNDVLKALDSVFDPQRVTVPVRSGSGTGKAGKAGKTVDTIDIVTGGAAGDGEPASPGYWRWGLIAVAVAAIASGIWKFMPRQESATPARTAAAAPRAQPPAKAPPAAVQPPATTPLLPAEAAQVDAALATLRCADVRADGRTGSGAVRLTGWRRAGTVLPDRVGTLALDAAGVSEESLDGEICEQLAYLRDAIGRDAPRLPLTARPEPYTSQPGNISFGLTAAIDDDEIIFSRVWQLQGGSVNATRFDLASALRGFYTSEHRPQRFLVAVVGQVERRDNGAAPMCRAEGCQFASAIVDIRPRR